MSEPIFHLVGFVAQQSFRPMPLHDFRIVSLCGARGPIAPRFDRSGEQGALFEGLSRRVRFCEACAALWDIAEQEGHVVTMFTWNGHQQWLSGNAPVINTLEPTPRWHREKEQTNGVWRFGRWRQWMRRPPHTRDRNGKILQLGVVGALRFTTAKEERRRAR